MSCLTTSGHVSCIELLEELLQVDTSEIWIRVDYCSMGEYETSFLPCDWLFLDPILHRSIYLLLSFRTGEICREESLFTRESPISGQYTDENWQDRAVLSLAWAKTR
jgi:hypothetical protein